MQKVFTDPERPNMATAILYMSDDGSGLLFTAVTIAEVHMRAPVANLFYSRALSNFFSHLFFLSKL